MEADDDTVNYSALTDQWKQMMTQLTHLTWFLGSEPVADFKVKTKTSTPCGSPGTGLPTPALDQWLSNLVLGPPVYAGFRSNHKCNLIFNKQFILLN